MRAWVISVIMMAWCRIGYADTAYKTLAEEARHHKTAIVNQGHAYLENTAGSEALNNMLLRENSNATAPSDLSQKVRLIIFVSNSLPEQSLIDYMKEAGKLQAEVVIRGLINESFKETLLRVSDLVKKSGGQGIAINPLLFKQYHVEAVPTILLVKGEEYDLLQGNITLASALTLLKEKGALTADAEEYLQKLKSNAHA